MDNNDNVFPKGMYFKKHQSAPNFVAGKVSIKREEAIKWLQEQKEDWINLQALEKKGKPGEFYMKIDEWKPKGDFDPAKTVPREDQKQVYGNLPDTDFPDPSEIPF